MTSSPIWGWKGVMRECTGVKRSDGRNASAGRYKPLFNVTGFEILIRARLAGMGVHILSELSTVQSE